MSTDLAAINVNPEALKAGEASLRADLAGLAELVIDSHPTALVVQGVLIEQLKALDVMQEQRDRVTKPLHEGWKNTCELFKPGLELQKEICAKLKQIVGAWELKQLQAKEAATQEARAALAVGDVATIERALTVVNTQAASAPGVSSRPVWKVKRYLETSSIDPEYLIPNEAKINALARAHKGDDPPFVRGVVFERDIATTGRRA